MATFLSTDWLTDLTNAVNTHDGFQAAIANVELTLQFEIPDAPEGAEGRYYMEVTGGRALAAAGDAPAADCTITNDYATAVAISKGDLNTQMAFMTGKIKVAGNMAKLMMNQAMLTQFANATAGMAVDY